MKRVNPLYVALLLLAALLVTVIRLHQSNARYAQTLQNLQQTELMARKIAALKTGWGDGNDNAAAIERILKASLLRNAGLTYEKLHSVMKISAKEMDRKAMEYLLNKLLNGTYAVKSMSIKRLDGQKASFEAEVAL